MHNEKKKSKKDDTNTDNTSADNGIDNLVPSSDDQAVEQSYESSEPLEIRLEIEGESIPISEVPAYLAALDSISAELSELILSQINDLSEDERIESADLLILIDDLLSPPEQGDIPSEVSADEEDEVISSDGADVAESDFIIDAVVLDGIIIDEDPSMDEKPEEEFLSDSIQSNPNDVYGSLDDLKDVIMATASGAYNANSSIDDFLSQITDDLASIHDGDSTSDPTSLTVMVNSDRNGTIIIGDIGTKDDKEHSFVMNLGSMTVGYFNENVETLTNMFKDLGFSIPMYRDMLRKYLTIKN